MTMMTLVMMMMRRIMRIMEIKRLKQIKQQVVGKDGESLLLLVARALGLQSR